jgi:ABC-type lipoprotein release transport system permease subunit
MLLALACTHILAGLLYEVSPTDATVFIGVMLLVFVITLLACWLPTRRATKIDPMEALRYE